jgi:sulfide:quinone oxidoreductase
MDIRRRRSTAERALGQPADRARTISADREDGGFRAIICNRPDGEGGDQPTFEEIEAAARAAGLEARAICPSSTGMVPTRMPRLSARRCDLPGPVLAYCRTGTRSATLWSLAEGGAAAAEILAPPRPRATT